MGADPQTAIEVRGVGVRYDLRLTEPRTLRRAAFDRLRDPRAQRSVDFWALRDVGFTVGQGETIGVIGRNGSGKSTLLLTVAGIIRPDEGSITTAGRPTLLTLGAGFEPELTGRQNVLLNGAYLGLSKREISRYMRRIVEYSELGAFIDAPLKKYSTGMRSRLGFAIAAHLDPEILLLDEVLGVGDNAFLQKSQATMREMMARSRAIMVVTHSPDFVRRWCSKGLWLEGGNVVAFGDPEQVVDEYIAATTHDDRVVREI